MSNFDLNDPVDFARVTMGPVAQVLGDLTGRLVETWDIVEAEYNGVKIHVFSSKSTYSAGLSGVKDTGGRRKVRYEFPYVDGQTTDDLGRKANNFEVDVLLHGNRYKEALAMLQTEFKKATPGVFRHPVFGEITCVIEDFEITHSSSERKAAAVRLLLTEHNFFQGQIAFKTKQDPTVKSALVACLDAVKAIDVIVTKIQANILVAQSFKTFMTNALAAYKTAYVTNLQRINKTFNNGSSVDLPTLLPVQEGGISNPDGSTSQSTFPVAVSPSDPFANIVDSEQQDLLLAAATVQVVNETNIIRDSLNDIITDLRDVLDGQGSLEFYDDILSLQSGSVAMQDALEKGIQSSRALVVSYTTPRLMSVREVAFAAGISPERSYEIETLNPSLLSMNFIEAGTTLKVPTA